MCGDSPFWDQRSSRLRSNSCCNRASTFIFKSARASRAIRSPVRLSMFHHDARWLKCPTAASSCWILFGPIALERYPSNGLLRPAAKNRTLRPCLSIQFDSSKLFFIDRSARVFPLPFGPTRIVRPGSTQIAPFCRPLIVSSGALNLPWAVSSSLTGSKANSSDLVGERIRMLRARPDGAGKEAVLLISTSSSGVFEGKWQLR